MYFRTISLSSPKRITEIKKLYQVELPETLLHKNLLHIHTPNTPILRQLSFNQNENTAIKYYINSDQTQVFLYTKPGTTIPKYLAELLPQLNQLNKSVKLKSWSIRDQILDFNKEPIIMGILNVTPDSFSDGGLFIAPDRAVERALQMKAEGARIIDIGGESSRPGSDQVSGQEEMARVVPIIEELRSRSNVLISIDTTKSEVARAALVAGADIVNDISALELDPKMLEVVQAVDCPVVIMHMKGTPKNMQKNPTYVDVSAEVYAYFQNRLSVLSDAGINRIALDPGIGFGKRIEDNLQLLRDLKDFKAFKLPILIGLSRKSFIGEILGRTVEQRLVGGLAANIFARQQGAAILRVHDIKETKDALGMYQAIAES